MMRFNLDFRYNFKFILCVYVIGAIISGYALAIIGGISDDIQHSFSLDLKQLSYLLGLLFLGGILAKFVWLLADYIGRKLLIVAFVIAFIIGTLIFISATTYTGLIIGRLLQGMGVILCSYALPVYMTEIAPKDKRGRYS